MLPKFYWQLLRLFCPCQAPLPTVPHLFFLESCFFVWNVQGMKERYKCRSVSNFGNCAWKNGSFAATLSYASPGLICNKPAIPFTVFCFHLNRCLLSCKVWSNFDKYERTNFDKYESFSIRLDQF